jgi:hypothetical protein
MDFASFAQIGIVGVALSSAIQYIKNKYGTSSLGSKGITIGLSVLVGGGFWYIQGTPFFEQVVAVLGSATVAYNFIVKPISE